MQHSAVCLGLYSPSTVKIRNKFILCLIICNRKIIFLMWIFRTLLNECSWETTCSFLASDVCHSVLLLLQYVVPVVIKWREGTEADHAEGKSKCAESTTVLIFPALWSVVAPRCALSVAWLTIVERPIDGAVETICSRCTDVQGAHHLSRPHLREEGNRLIQKNYFYPYLFSFPFFFF